MARFILSDSETLPSDEDQAGSMRPVMLRTISQGMDSDAPPHNDVVDLQIQRLGDWIREVKRRGDEMPDIDLSGIDPRIIENMDVDPDTTPAVLLPQLFELKRGLREKYGRAGSTSVSISV